MTEELIPFRSLVTEESFKRPGMPIQRIYTLKDNLEVIIRAGLENEYYIRGIRSGDKPWYYSEHLNNRDVLNRLKDEYGILVPKFNIVIGGEGRFYIVTQRVHGGNLYEKQFSENERPEAEMKLSRLYSSLADVLIDTCNRGGLMVSDLVRAGANTSGNKQWVYGKRKGDLEPQPWLVDLGPAVEFFQPQDILFFQKQFPYLFEMIIETEEKLNCRFGEVREKVLGYMQAERSKFRKEDWRSQEIDTFFLFKKLLGKI